jgi:hypothetical protein
MFSSGERAAAPSGADDPDRPGQSQHPFNPDGRNVGGKSYAYYSLPKAAEALGDISRLPFSMKVLLENLLRFEDGVTVTRDDLQAMVDWQKERRISARDPVPPGARADAGLHRRARGRRPRRDARRDEAARRRPAEDQPAGAGPPGHRP